MSLAEEAGIRVAAHRLVCAGDKSISVITRFDRQGAVRIPFLSAASLLGLAPGARAAYTQLGDAIRQFGHDVTGDLRELWRRLIFSLLTSNYDDHPRNHGFLMLAPGRWSLPPAYDVNPVPEMYRAWMNKTSFAEEMKPATIAAGLAAAPRFGLGSVEAHEF